MTAGIDAGRRISVLAVLVLLSGLGIGLGAGWGGAAAVPSQAATTVVSTAVVPVASTAPAPAGTAAVTEATTASAVGDPEADRRINRIVLVLCALALIVLLVTVAFWRATRPVPRALRRLQVLGSRAGRRKAAASEPVVLTALDVAAPSLPGEGPALDGAAAATEDGPVSVPDVVAAAPPPPGPGASLADDG